MSIGPCVQRSVSGEFHSEIVFRLPADLVNPIKCMHHHSDTNGELTNPELVSTTVTEAISSLRYRCFPSKHPPVM